MNLLPLEEWRSVMGYHPEHFWGLRNSKVPVTSSSNSVMRQYDWQTADRVGRSEIIQAIENAEALLMNYLHYAPAPHYRADAFTWPQNYQPDQWRLFPIDALGRRLAITLNEGYIQKMGVETLTDIETVTIDPLTGFLDKDGDGIKETFSIVTTLPLGTTDPDEIAVYFQASDRLDDDMGRWRIQPVKVSIAAGIATVTGKTWLIVRPILYEGIAPVDIDPDNLTNYAAKLEVKRHWTDGNGNTNDTSQALVTWETLPGYMGSINPTNSTDPGATGNAVARCGIRNAELGIVTPAEAIYDSTSSSWTNAGYECPHRPPDRVVVRYLAGLPLVNGHIDRQWQITTARLAAAELTRAITASDVGNRELYHWQFDLSRGGGKSEEQFQVSQEDLSNPFGTRRGHLYAWRQVKNLALIRGILV